VNQRKVAFSIAVGAVLAAVVVLNLSHAPTLVSASRDAGLVNKKKRDLEGQDAADTAYVVVRFGDRDTIVRAITFTEPITAYRALELAELQLDVAETAFGRLLCGIEGVGQTTPDGTACDNGTRNWNTTYWGDGAWTLRAVGVDDAVISQTGHVEGFSYSDPDYERVDPPAAPPLTAAAAALSWLRAQQQSDGGFGSMNQTAEVLMAASANKMDGSDWGHSPSLLANTLRRGPGFANRNASGAGKLAVVLAAQGTCWPLSAPEPISYYDPVSGTYSSDAGPQAWAIAGTLALAQSVPASAIDALKDLQQSDGGWEWFAGFGSDTNTTALALQALVAAGESPTSNAIEDGVAYLEDAQNDDGGFLWIERLGTESDTNSTAYVVQGLLAVGEDPRSGRWTVGENDPIGYLLSMQLPDGSFEWQKGTGANQFATQQVVPALLQRSLPMAIDDLDACYGMAGRVVDGETADPLPDVALEAQGAGDLFSATTDAAGAYTISVPSATSYALKPFTQGLSFTPPMQTIEVSGEPGAVVSVPDFTATTPILRAAFTGSPTSGVAPLVVDFTDQSTGTITEWTWDFGDGDSSTTQNPRHTYDGADDYTVSLTVSGPGGSDTETKSNYIRVSEPPPEGDDYEPDDSCDQASPIATDGTVQIHTFHQHADKD
jgi:hypothetical protein